MAESNSHPGLREMIRENSAISDLDRSGARAIEIIHGTLVSLLEPGEIVLEYVDRRLPTLNQTDAYAYGHDEPNRETDALAYPHREDSPQVDALAYDIERGRLQPDVLAYEGGGAPQDTDAFAYVRPPHSPAIDALISDTAGPRAADVDLLLLTDRRLIRGILRDEKIMVAEAPCQAEDVRVTVAELGRPANGLALEGAYIAISLPSRLCRTGENDQWHWRVPEGRDVQATAKKWGSSLR